MKKYIFPTLAAFVVSGLLLGVVYFGDKAQAYTPPPKDFTGQEVAFFATIPPPLTAGSLTSSLFCPRIEARSGKLIMASLWAKLPPSANNKIVMAHAQAYNFGGTIGYVMLITGPRIWVRILKETIDQVAAQDAGTKMLGPLPIKSLESKSAAICKGIALKFLTPLTGVQDGGLPRSPYTEGGSWPVEEVLTCADGTKFRLQTAMNGLPLSSMDWTTLPPLSSWQEAPAGPIQLLPCSADWKDPDRGTTKYCGPVPIGFQCP